MGICQSFQNQNSSSIQIIGGKNIKRTNKKAHKINAIDDDEDKIIENVTIKKNPIEKFAKKRIQQALKKHFFFYNLNISQIQYIIQKMFYCQTQKGQYVFKKGDDASSFFIIDSGELSIQVNPENIVDLKTGQSFGQLALIYNAKRSASVLTKTKCTFWCISRSTFKQTLIDIVGKTYTQARPYMDKVSLFQHFTKKQKDAVAHAMTLLKFEKGKYVFKQNDDANSFFIIKEGQVTILINDKQVNKMKQGDSFGDQALFNTSLRSASVMANTKAMILSIGRQQMQNILGDQVLKVIYININKWAINKSPILSKLTAIQVQKILSQVQELKASSNQTIFKQGQLCNKIIFCTKITLVNKNTLEVVCQWGKIFGQQYLLAQNEKSVLLQTITAKQQGVYCVVSFDTIKKILQKPLQKIFEQNRKKTQLIANKKKHLVDYSYLSLQNLVTIKRLGEGQFGKVYLVKQKQKDKDKLFALKCIQKNQVIANRMQKITIQQKKILELIDFPYIMHYYRSFKDDFFLYLLLEHVRGVQLFDVLRQIGLVNNSISKFYLSSIILAIQYLHSNNIIYRDLKPQNIMVQTSGYLRIIDFGTAKILDQAKGFKTFTIIGTPHYMGPQVMQGKGYTFSSDLWSIGVVFYQFLCGQLPYAQKLDDPYQIYYEVMKNPLRFPQGFYNTKAKKLIEQLLNKCPQFRLGRSWAALKANVYFDGFDWDQLFQKTMPSPYTSRLCAKQQYQIKKLEYGKPFLQEIMKQKKNLRKAQSTIPHWDAQF